MNSPLQPLDRRLLGHRRGALTLAAALAAFVALCWIVIQLHGSFPGDSYFVSWIRHPHPGEQLGFVARVFAALGNPIVAGLCVAIVWVVIDDDLGPRYGILVLAAVGAVAFNALLKEILGPTPLEMSVRGSSASGNIPSGHVVYITSARPTLASVELHLRRIRADRRDLREPFGAGPPAPHTSGIELTRVLRAGRRAPRPRGEAQLREVGTGTSAAPAPFGDAPSAGGPPSAGVLALLPPAA
jgi:hypothetical protein